MAHTSRNVGAHSTTCPSKVIYRVYISGARGNNSQGRCKTISREVLTSSHLPSIARHGGFLAMFPEGGNTSKHSFLAMFFEGGQTRKQCFFVMFTKCGQSFSAIFSSNVSQSGKQCFLVMFTECGQSFSAIFSSNVSQTGNNVSLSCLPNVGKVSQP